MNLPKFRIAWAKPGTAPKHTVAPTETPGVTHVPQTAPEAPDLLPETPEEAPTPAAPAVALDAPPLQPDAQEAPAANNTTNGQKPDDFVRTSIRISRAENEFIEKIARKYEAEFGIKPSLNVVLRAIIQYQAYGRKPEVNITEILQQDRRFKT